PEPDHLRAAGRHIRLRLRRKRPDRANPGRAEPADAPGQVGPAARSFLPGDRHDDLRSALVRFLEIAMHAELAELRPELPEIGVDDSQVSRHHPPPWVPAAPL